MNLRSDPKRNAKDVLGHRKTYVVVRVGEPPSEWPRSMHGISSSAISASTSGRASVSGWRRGRCGLDGDAVRSRIMSNQAASPRPAPPEPTEPVDAQKGKKK